MLRWLLVVPALAAAGILVFTNPLKFRREPHNALNAPPPPPPQCWAQAWVRAPDMVPGDVIVGDVRIKLNGPACADVESYGLGLRYKEMIFWKLRPESKYSSMDSTRDVLRARMPFQHSGNPHYNELPLRALEWAFQKPEHNKDLWPVHEEERIAFEIKTPLVSAEGADPLPTTFTSQFGILVPNTNYPPGFDYRHGAEFDYRNGAPGRRGIVGGPDIIRSESNYEYFVEIRFSNGTTWNIPAGITAFNPFYVSTEDETPSVNVSMSPSGPGRGPRRREQLLDKLSSNYTVEVSFPEGTQINQDSSVNITATVHRTGYTSRTDIPLQLCASSTTANEWRPRELKNRSQPGMSYVKALVPSIISSMNPSMQQSQKFQVFQRPCREIKFVAAPAGLTHEGHISSTSSEPLSFSVHVPQGSAPAFLTYYQNLGHRVTLNLQVKPDPSEPWGNDFEKKRWEQQKQRWRQQTRWMDEADFDWVPWSFPTQHRLRNLNGNADVSFSPMQDQRPVQPTPVHYLSNEARQPAFVDVSDIADLRSMTTEERDLLAPIAQPSIKVSEGGELPNWYFTPKYMIMEHMEQPIYVGDTWLNKVLSVVAEGHHERDMDGFLDMQGI
ncbi:hypothetical protein DEU56DRAFT_981165 [Suillus clintonianus]|uniref:uncharacterized protein n=1 Tax=Suillus clintonianus TaxID=1904413 RepID=UPI001B8838A2|nr:uncharacterized protein DEU56DRAFT_981165 [Suillus clintonianus]KAG2135299.1 hypothetical protein DEU56DRAFT_981165 [Suillus clintonianus]